MLWRKVKYKCYGKKSNTNVIASDTNGFEDTFENTQWRKVKHECYALDTNGSDDTFENTQLRKVRHKCYS